MSIYSGRKVKIANPTMEHEKFSGIEGTAFLVGSMELMAENVDGILEPDGAHIDLYQISGTGESGIDEQAFVDSELELCDD